MPAPSGSVNLLANIPPELTKIKQWLVWRADPNGRKIPYIATGRATRKASSTNATTWRSFGHARGVVDRGLADGVGFVFTADDPYVGIDLDNKNEDPTKDETNKFWVDTFNSYTERSPSGTGYHVIVRAPEGLPKGVNRNGFEAYSSGRYFTFTGDVVNGRHVINERSAALRSFQNTFGGAAAEREAFVVPETIVEGNRNDTLFRLGCSLRTKGIPAREVATLLRYAGAGASLSPQEVRNLIASVERYEYQDQRDAITYAALAAEYVVFVESEERYWDCHTEHLYGRGTLDDKYVGRMAPLDEGEDTRPPPSKILPHLSEFRVVSRLSWWPGREIIFQLEGQNVLNQYRGPISKGKRGSVQRWMEHFAWLVPNKPLREHILDWMAHAVQYPGTKINHGLLLGGAPRIGKDLLFAPVEVALGPHNVKEPRAKDLEGDFNWYEESAVLIKVQEIHGFQQMEQEDQLKSLLASPPTMTTINVKNRKQYQQPNVSKVVFMTNHLQPLRISPGNQARYCCVWCKPDKPAPPAYYRRLGKWYAEDGGIEAVVYALRKRNVATFDPTGSPPLTEWAVALLGASSHELLERYEEELSLAEGVWSFDVVPARAVRAWCEEQNIKPRVFTTQMQAAGAVAKAVQVKLRGVGYKKLNLWIIRDVEHYLEQSDRELAETAWKAFPLLDPRKR